VLRCLTHDTAFTDATRLTCGARERSTRRKNTYVHRTESEIQVFANRYLRYSACKSIKQMLWTFTCRLS
jgi:hypothetical protein